MKQVRNIHKNLVRFSRSNEFVIFVVIILISVLFAFINPTFISTRNIFDILKSMIVNCVFACGVMLVIINGGIDMSFMAIGIVSAYLTIQGCILVDYNGGIHLIFLVAALIGMMLGLCNAFLISKFDIPIFIVTLSVASVIRGLVLAFIGNEYVASTDMPTSTIEFSKTYWFNMVDETGSTFGLHFGVFIAIGIMILTFLILRYTVIGRGVYALGGDTVSAARIGYDLKKVRRFIYGYAGVLAGIAGIIYVSNNRMADPVSLQGQELTVIAAVVIGGTKITGGKGTVFGVFLGVLLTQIINTNLVLIGVPSFWQKFTFGSLIIAATVFQALKDKKGVRA
ncbi:MAG: ABC transporter permease [Tissierellaceae bacterium]|nr:ABC transporter permease [Tissierellaceae bacterium]